MVDASVQTEKLTIDEFMRLYESEGPFEIIDGERVEKVPTGYKHGRVTHALYDALRDFLKAHSLGTAYMEMTFIVPESDKRQWVKGSRIPDVMFYAKERLATYDAQNDEEDDDRAIMIVPDLAVEIVSKNDSYEDLDHKVQLYLEDGVEQVWVVNPKTQTVTVHEGSTAYTLKKDDTLSGGDIIPGFEIRIAALFEESGGGVSNG